MRYATVCDDCARERIAPGSLRFVRPTDRANNSIERHNERIHDERLD